MLRFVVSKINPLHLFVNGGYIYIIDDYDNIWTKHVPNGDWEIIDTLPEVVGE
jgi:hypothetical protein